MLPKTLALLLIAASLGLCECANILGAVFTPSYSHQVAFRPIWRALAERGHQVTLLTTDPMRDPSLNNLREIDLGESYGIVTNITEYLSLNQEKYSVFSQIDLYTAALGEAAELQLRHPEVQEIIKDKNRRAKFDVLLVEVIFPTQMALAAHLGVPFIGLVSLDAPPRIHAALGNPTHPALYPDFMLPVRPPLAFKERALSLLVWLYMRWFCDRVMYPREDATVRRLLDPSAPPLADVQANMSMLFLNANPVFHGVRPVGPSTVFIGGGAHLKSAKPLPKEIQDYADSATKGLIYFSLGTNVQSKYLGEPLIKEILDTFRELPYKILWKFENENLPNKPDNVKIMKWVPQQDLFVHPNLKLFITQCGLQSMEEALFNHIPMVGMPFFGDQLSNGKIMETKAFGVQVNHKALTKEGFKAAIVEVIENPMYREKAANMARLLADVERPGVERAVWWTEYVIRHGGAPHLRGPAADAPLYQLLFLDVAALLLAALLVVLALLVGMARCVLRLCRRKRKTE